MTAYLTIIHVLSALHAGTGQGSGVIDLPIAREKATGLPYLPGSSLKGALRTNCNKMFPMRFADGREKQVKCEQIFGSENAENGANSAGTVQITDQRLLLLPVRSLAGTFAWVTSPYVLYRLARDLEDLHLLSRNNYSVPHVADLQSCMVSGSSLMVDAHKVYLEDLDLSVQDDSAHSANASATFWANWLSDYIFREDADGREMLKQQFCIVHDDAFSFLLETATEITARIHLQEESKTVQKGGLWYEEALPAESVLCGLALTTPRSKKENGDAELTPQELNEVFQYVAQKTLQLGGKSTVGRGQCRVRVFGEGA